MNFFCTYWGDKYPIKYVQNLHRMVGEHYSGQFSFFCQTDIKLNIAGVEEIPFLKYTPDYADRFPDKPKLNFWKPNGWGITGRKVFLDLDVVILNDLSKVIDLFSSRPIIGKSWWQGDHISEAADAYLAYRGITNGSVYVWEDSDATASIWDHVQKFDKEIFYTCINGSDNYLSTFHLDKFDFVPQNMMFSYHNSRTIDKASVICTVDTKKNHIHYGTQKELHELDGWISEKWNGVSSN